MTKRWAQLIPMIAAALMFYVLSPSAHHAQLFAEGDDAAVTAPEGTPSKGDIQTVGPDGGKISCGAMTGPDGKTSAKDGILMGYIVPCVTMTISITTENFSAKMLDFFKPTIYSFITFVIAMFGVKVLQGSHDVHKEGFLLLLKIALVIGILEMIPHEIVPSVYGIMASNEEIVASTLGGDMESSIHCDVSKYKGADTPLVWAQMDCVLGKLYGITSGSGGGEGGKSRNMFLAASAFGLLAGFFFSGTLGIAIFFGLIGVLISVFMLVLRSAVAFINGHLIVCMMLLISPLFLPLVLLRVTNNYFEPWWKNILGGFLLPVLITAFAMFSLLLYDKVLFAPDSLLNKILDYANVEGAEQPASPACTQAQTNNPSTTRAAGGTRAVQLVNINRPNNPIGGNFAMQQTRAGVDICQAAQMPVFNLADGSEAFKNARASFLTIFKDCMKLMILGWLIHAGVGYVMNAMRTLTGGTCTHHATRSQHGQRRWCI